VGLRIVGDTVPVSGETPTLVGWNDWTTLSVPVHVESPGLVTVHVIRHRSPARDGAIAGTAQVDSVELVRQPTP
jgi:hypothetical protein